MRRPTAGSLPRMIVKAPDQLVVYRNADNLPSRVDGVVYPFLGHGSKREAYADEPDSPVGLGTPVPATEAIEAGWTLYGPWCEAS